MADFFGKLKDSLKEANLKENFEDLKKTITDKAEVAKKATEEAVEIQKIKSQIRNMERSNERDFSDMGKKIYEKFKNSDVVDTEFVEFCEAIAGREEAIAAAKKQIADIKGLSVCPNCKENVNADVVFCPKCGTKLEDEVFDVEDDSEDIFEEIIDEVKEAVEELVD